MATKNFPAVTQNQRASIQRCQEAQTRLREAEAAYWQAIGETIEEAKVPESRLAVMLGYSNAALRMARHRGRRVPHVDGRSHPTRAEVDHHGACPGCGLTGGFHEHEDGVPVCGHLDVEKTGWRYVGRGRPAHSEYDELWYEETEEPRVGIRHVIRVKRGSPAGGVPPLVEVGHHG